MFFIVRKKIPIFDNQIYTYVVILLSYFFLFCKLVSIKKVSIRSCFVDKRFDGKKRSQIYLRKIIAVICFFKYEKTLNFN